MPNLKILQDQPEKLKNQIYGFSGSNVVPLLTDAAGHPDIRPLASGTDSVTVVASALDIRPLTSADTVTVTASDLDIRNLASGTDSVTVVATALDIRPLTSADTVTVTAADLDIRNLASGTDSVTVVATALDIRPLTSADTVSAIVAISHTEDAAVPVTTANAYVGTTGKDVTTWRNFSYFIENTSSSAVSGTVKIQISPDNVKWVDDSAEETLAQNGMTVLFTSRYLKYARVAYKSTVADTPADLSITFQAQG